MNVSPESMQTLLMSTGALSNPKGTALSFLGFSPEEQKAGVPIWAWGILVLGAGVYLGNKYGSRMKGLIK